MEYNPSEYPLLISPILEENADVVYGSRFVTVPFCQISSLILIFLTLRRATKSLIGGHWT
jgi:hypothetical protein